jgi:hypothetical protein
MPSLKELDELNQKALGAAAPKRSLADLDAMNEQALASPPRKGVELVDTDGSRRVFSEDEAPLALAQGFRPAAEVDAEQRQADLQAEYGGLGGRAMTLAQEGLSGLTGGLSEPLSAALTASIADDYQGPRLTPEARAKAAELGLQDDSNRSSFDLAYEGARGFQKDLKEANPGTAVAGQLGGAALGAIGSRGSSLLARGLANTPAGLITRGGNAIAKTVGGLGTGTVTGALARTAGATLAGTAEGALISGIGAIADELPNFDVDPQAAGEHVLAAMGSGALLGGALGGTLGGALEVGKGFAAGGKAILDAALDRGTQGLLPNREALQDFAYESATKAAIGRTNIAAVREAERFGGTKAIGKSLLDEGVVANGDNVASIYQKAEAGSAKYGQQLGALIDQLDGAGLAPDTATIARRIRESVIDPTMASPSSRARGEALNNRLGPLLDELDNGGFADFRALWKERQSLDFEAKQLFGSDTPTAQGLKDARRAMEDAFMEQAEGVAGPQWTAQYANAKTKYSHMRFAADQAQEALNSQQSNRFFSPSDYGMALGSGVAGGPVAGIAMGLANKVARDRGRATVASVLNQFANEGAQRSALVSLANSGAQHIAGAAQALVANVGRARYGALGAVTQALTPEDFQTALADAQELQDPNSPASQELVQNAQQLDAVNPGMGMAYVQSARAGAQLIANKLPKNTSAAIFAPRPVLDPITERSLQRTVQAAKDPRRTFERIASGDHSPEDIETLRTVYPGLYKAFQQHTQQALAGLRQQPDLETRLRIGYALGLPTDPSLAPDNLRALQAAAAMGNQQGKAEQQGKGGGGPPQGGPQMQKAPSFADPNDVYASQTDRIMDRR